MDVPEARSFDCDMHVRWKVVLNRQDFGERQLIILENPPETV